MIGFELTTRPAVSLLKLNSEEIICLFKLAVFDSSLTAILRKLESDDCVGGYGYFKSNACARSGNIFQDCPLTSSRSGLFLPLNFDKISAKFSILLSIGPHNYSIGKPKQLFRLNRTRRKRRIQKNGDWEEEHQICSAFNRMPAPSVSPISRDLLFYGCKSPTIVGFLANFGHLFCVDYCALFVNYNDSP